MSGSSWNLGHDETSSSPSFPPLHCETAAPPPPPLKERKTCSLFPLLAAMVKVPRPSDPPARLRSFPLSPVSSLAAPNARRLSGISSCPLSLGGESKKKKKNRGRNRSGGRLVEKREGQKGEMLIVEADKFTFFLPWEF